MPDYASAWIGKLDDIATGGGLQQTQTPIINADAGPASEYHDQATQGASVVPRSLLLVVPDDTPGPFGAPVGQTAVRSRRSGDKEPWKSAPDIVGRIEDQFLMPTLLGSSIVHHQMREPELAVIPWNGTELLHSTHPSIDAHPGLAAWWRQAEGRWDTLGKGKMTFEERTNYQNTLTCQFPIPSIRVAYTTSGTYLAAAVIDDATIVIDHALYWIPVTTLGEANYLTAVLNSDAPRASRRTKPVTPSMLSCQDSASTRPLRSQRWALPINRFRRHGRRSEQRSTSLVSPTSSTPPSLRSRCPKPDNHRLLANHNRVQVGPDGCSRRH